MFSIWSEETRYVNNAIAREKQLKRWLRKDKEALITAQNPAWKFWNDTVLGNWPPTDAQVEAVKLRWRNTPPADRLSFIWQIQQEEGMENEDRNVE